MPDLQRAIEIAVAAHKGVTDKSGKQPYLTHPLRVMLSLQSAGEVAQIVGILHDVVEDTDVSLDDLRREGFPDDVLSALALVTHAKSEPYEDYVVRLKSNAIAKAVKLADLQDNTRLDRSIIRTDDRALADRQRSYKYVLTYKFLIDELGEADYRRLMKANV
jgi:(p)ppGpp synthase/HD superfamily hydrolase